MMSWMPADDGANTSRATPLPYRIAKEISPVFTAFAHATSVRCVEYIFVASVAQWIEHFSPKEGVVGSIPIWGTFSYPRTLSARIAIGSIQDQSHVRNPDNTISPPPSSTGTMTLPLL